MKEAKKKEIPMVIDGDGLFLITNEIEFLKGYEKNVILTPNIIEYRRLVNKVVNGKAPTENPKSDFGIHPKDLSMKLNGITIVVKGEKDIITNGKDTLECDEVGSLKRSGGQGDILAGAIGTFFNWAFKNSSSENFEERKLEACYAACLQSRIASKMAFKKMARGMIADDAIDLVPFAFDSLFADPHLLDHSDSK